MGIRDEVAADRQQSGLRGPPCGVRTILEVLQDDERKDVEEAVMDSSGAMPASSLARVMESRGYRTQEGTPIRAGTILKHRSKGCGCFR